MAVIIKGKNPGKPHTVRYWVDGRQREKSFVNLKGHDGAQAWKIKVEHDARAQIFVDPKESAAKFGPYAQAWLDKYPCSDGTRKGYQGILGRHLDCLRDRSLASIAQDHEGISALLMTTLPAKPLGASRVRQARMIIMAVMDLAVVQGKIAGHRLASIKTDPPGRTRRPFTLASRAQAGAIATAMPNGLGLAVWLMHGCGLRIEEALAVSISGFRDNGQTLRIREQADASGKFTKPLKHRKEGEFRDMPVPAWLWQKVSAHETQPGGYLFKGRHSSFPGYNPTRASFMRHARTAGLPVTFTPHSLRHGYASTLLAAKVPITDLAQWLGHRDINETYGTYGHLVPSAWGEARDALDAAWAA